MFNEFRKLGSNKTNRLGLPPCNAKTFKIVDNLLVVGYDSGAIETSYKKINAMKKLFILILSAIHPT